MQMKGDVDAAIDQVGEPSDIRNRVAAASRVMTVGSDDGDDDGGDGERGVLSKADRPSGSGGHVFM